MDKFIVIRRATGETFYFNLSHIGMICENPEQKLVQVVGAGFEKNFSPSEAQELLQEIRRVVTNPGMLEVTAPAPVLVDG